MLSETMIELEKYTFSTDIQLKIKEKFYQLFKKRKREVGEDRLKDIISNQSEWQGMCIGDMARTQHSLAGKREKRVKESK